MTTAGADSRWRTVSSTASPSPSGSRMSSTTRSGRNRGMSANASRAVLASPITSTPGTASSSSVRRSRSSAESSTRTTRTGCTIGTAALRCYRTDTHTAVRGILQRKCPSLRGELVLDRVADQVSRRAEPHFLENPRPVGADGFGGEGQLFGDLGEAPADPEQTQNLVLASGEIFVRRRLMVGLHRFGQLVGDGRGEIAAPGRDLADGRDQLFGGAFLGEVAGRAVPQRAHGELALRVHAQH